MNWAVPWTGDEVIDLIFLVVTCAIVIAVPMVYGVRANLRDRLARAVVIGTSATAAAFSANLAVVVAVHSGWNPDPGTYHWLGRGIYVSVAYGKLILLLALLDAIHEVSRNTDYENFGDDEEPGVVEGASP
jgi:hypothetical protein